MHTNMHSFYSEKGREPPLRYKHNIMSSLRSLYANRGSIHSLMMLSTKKMHAYNMVELTYQGHLSFGFLKQLMSLHQVSLTAYHVLPFGKISSRINKQIYMGQLRNLIAFSLTKNTSCMWPTPTHMLFYLNILDQINNCMIQLAVANHTYYHFKFHHTMLAIEM